MRAIVIGRHAPSGKEGIRVVGNKNEAGIPQPRSVNFPATAEDCHPIIWELLQEAVKEDCKLIFQAVPFQLGAAIHNIATDDVRFRGRIGGIVNVPGKRPAGVKKTFWLPGRNAGECIMRAVRFVNPRAKTLVHEGETSGCEITADPPLRFEFSHIQWLDGSTSNMSLRGFFSRFGLPQSWIDEEGDLLINEDDSNQFPNINDGDEVSLSGRDLTIDGMQLTIRSKSRLTTDFFSAEMDINNPAENEAALIRAINEAKDNESQGEYHE